MGLTIHKTLLKHKRVILFVSSLKKTVMKLTAAVFTENELNDQLPNYEFFSCWLSTKEKKACLSKITVNFVNVQGFLMVFPK